MPSGRRWRLAEVRALGGSSVTSSCSAIRSQVSPVIVGEDAFDVVSNTIRRTAIPVPVRRNICSKRTLSRSDAPPCASAKVEALKPSGMMVTILAPSAAARIALRRWRCAVSPSLPRSWLWANGGFISTADGTGPRSRSAISSPSCAVIMAEEKIWARPSRLAGSISLRSSEAFWRQPQRARAPLPADGSRSVSCAQTAAAFAISQASIGGVENCWSSTCASLRTCRGGKAASIQSNRASASCTFVARSIRDDSRSQSSAPISTALL